MCMEPNSKELRTNNTEFIPVDRTFFNLVCFKNNSANNIQKLYLTASGGHYYTLFNRFKI